MADLLKQIMENPKSIAKQYRKDKNYYRTIKKMLSSPSPEVRIQALKSIAVLKTNVLPKLLLNEDLLKDSDQNVREQLIKTFQQIGDLVLEPLIDKLAREKQRAYIVELINDIGKDEFGKCIDSVKIVSPEKALYYEIILKVFHPDLTGWDYSCYDRKLNYETTFQHSVDDTVNVLVRAFREDDEKLKYNALLASQSYPQIGKHLEKYVVSASKSDDDEVVKEALETLVKINVPSTIPVISNLLRDDNPEVRMDAARLLGELGSDEAIKALINQIGRENDDEVLQSIEMALGNIGEAAAPYLVEKLRREENMESVEVALKRIGAPAVKYISEAMVDPNRTIRANATKLSILIYTSEYGFGGTVVKLVELLKDKSDEVREAVIQSIINMGDPAIEYIIQSLGTMDERIRDASVEILDRFSDLNVKMILIDVRKNKIPARAAELGLNLAVQHPSPELKDLGYSMLLDVSKDSDADWEAITFKLKEYLRVWLEDRDPDIRFSAAQVANLFDSIFLPELHEIVQNERDPDIWEVAIESLGEIGKKASATVPSIGKRLRRADEQAKITIYEALGKIGTPTTLPYLIEGLGEDTQEVQDEVISAFKELGDVGYGALINALEHRDDIVRQNAVEILIEAGPEVILPLIQSMDSSDDAFNAAATKIFLENKEKAGPRLKEGLKTSETQAQANIMKNLALLKYKDAIPEVIEVIRYGDKSIWQPAADFIQIFGTEAMHRFVELFNFNDPETLKNCYEISLRIESPHFIPLLIETVPTVQNPGLDMLRKVINKKGRDVIDYLTELKTTEPENADLLIKHLVTDDKLSKLGEKAAKS